jgi:hypothetical protein
MRRVRFSLRLFLILVSIVAVLLAIFGKRIHNAHKQRQLITLIQSYGGENYHDLNFKNHLERTIRLPNMDFSPAVPGPEWLRRRVGDEYFVNVAEAFFDKPSHRVLDDAMFQEFAKHIRTHNLPRPRGLVFADLPITDATIRELSTFPNLTSLHILNCPNVTDAGLEHIGSLTKLRRLDLRGASITDRGISRLTNLRDLRELSLKGTAVTDRGLLYLTDLSNLEWLALSDTQVTSDGAKTLKEDLPDCVISW